MFVRFGCSEGRFDLHHSVVAEAVNKAADDIDPDIEFMYLGMDSLDAVDMMADLTDALDLEEDDDIFECETLREIADYLIGLRDAEILSVAN